MYFGLRVNFEHVRKTFLTSKSDPESSWFVQIDCNIFIIREYIQSTTKLFVHPSIFNIFVHFSESFAHVMFFTEIIAYILLNSLVRIINKIISKLFILTRINQFIMIFSTIRIILSFPILHNSPVKFVTFNLLWKLSVIFLFFMLINILKNLASSGH